MKWLFLVKKLKRSCHVDKIYKKGTVNIYNPEIHIQKLLKIYHINGPSSLFPYFDFGKNYRENEQKNFLQSRY